MDPSISVFNIVVKKKEPEIEECYLTEGGDVFAFSLSAMEGGAINIFLPKKNKIKMNNIHV